MISAVVLTANEETNISRCLKSLIWCNEVIVIDDNSTDKTVKIAKRFGAKVFKKSLENNFANQRNYGLSKAKNKWILFVDADEEVPLSLKKEIQGLNLDESKVKGFFLKRKDIWLGKALNFGEPGKMSLLRLARKGSGKWVRSVHETWQIKEETQTLKNSLLHYPHPTVFAFLKDINNYSTLHAKENKKEGKKGNPLFIIIYPLGKFIVNYFLKLGFLDGVRGFIVAILMSFHSFLSWSKLWLG